MPDRIATDAIRSEKEFARVREVVERVVRARVRDHNDAEDAIQETLARFLAARRKQSIERVEHYAATIALNVVRAQWRYLERTERALPRMLERRSAGEPVDDLLVEEEQRAITTALDDLPKSMQELLVRHEIDGRTTVDLAGEHATPGAIAASLARSRARLRVAYLLTFRHISAPPTCRSMLEAVSAADSRRLQRLGGAEHLDACSRCRDLAGVLQERSRADLGALPFLALAGRALKSGAARLRSPGGAATPASAAAVAAAVIVTVIVGAGSVTTHPPSAGSPTPRSAVGVAQEPAPTTPGSPTRTYLPPAIPVRQTPSDATGVDDHALPTEDGETISNRGPATTNALPAYRLVLDLPSSAPIADDEVEVEVVDSPVVDPAAPIVCDAVAASSARGVDAADCQPTRRGT